MTGDSVLKADDLIEAILLAHENHVGVPIVSCGEVTLHPMRSYSGTAATDAFGLWMRGFNKGRKYAGLFDFTIHFRGNGISHKPDVIRPAVCSLPLEAVRKVHEGLDPASIGGLNSNQVGLACCIQAAFAEQEVNWGEEIFQQRTYFGRVDMTDRRLKESAPRDYLMVYIERCAHEAKKPGSIPEDVVKKLAKLVKTGKRSKNVRLPIKKGAKNPKDRPIEPAFGPFLPSVICGKPIPKWIDSHLQHARKIVAASPESQYYRE